MPAIHLTTILCEPITAQYDAGRKPYIFWEIHPCTNNIVNSLGVVGTGKLAFLVFSRAEDYG